MTISSISSVNCVLFDLDGTLIDTAPDMVNALNRVLEEENCSPLPYKTCRSVVSHGSPALLELGFGQDLPPKENERIRTRFLDLYAQNLCVDTKLFSGMDNVLDYLENSGIFWGIVTNKPERFALPLLEEMNLRSRACSIVCGDTLAKNKPDPEPMLHALTQCGCSAENSFYVGDAQRDIEAGRNVNMMTVLALFGYIADGDEFDSWGADIKIKQALDIIEILETYNQSCKA
ncbi:MAG: HAD-IA family hydrolase [Cocleimonas sp.]|nr:HAD-IA family hydrolase [Cocleimonas sp.]